MKNKIIDILSENIEQMSKEDIAAAYIFSTSRICCTRLYL